MPKLETFDESFWEYYNQKKFGQIIKNIPELLKLEYKLDNVYKFQKLCSVAIYVTAQHASSDEVAINHVAEICKKYESVVKFAQNPIEAVQYFISLEYVCDLSHISKAMLNVIDNIASAVLNRVKNWKHLWTDSEMSQFNRFIIVLVELESKFSSSDDGTPTFTTAREAINVFVALIPDENWKSVYPKYMLSILSVIVSYSEDNSDNVNELMELRQENLQRTPLTKNKYGKDTAIMVSQIIRAGVLMISKGSTMYKQKIVTIMKGLYEIIRNKTFPPCQCQYTLRRTYDDICCETPLTHAGLQIMETVRIIVVKAIMDGSFNEVLISGLTSLATVEADNIFHFNCKVRDDLKWNLWRTLFFVWENIEKIVATCGLKRGKRTLQKLLAVDSLEASDCVEIINKLLKICKDAGNRTEKISWLAMKLLLHSDEVNRMSCMHHIHQIQAELDPQHLKTISAIAKELPKRKYLVSMDLIQLQLLQIKAAIDNDQLPEVLLRKLVHDVAKMDFYKNDQSHYANLCRAGICYLESKLNTKQMFTNWTELNSSTHPGILKSIPNNQKDKSSAAAASGKTVGVFNEVDMSVRPLINTQNNKVAEMPKPGADKKQWKAVSIVQPKKKVTFIATPPAEAASKDPRK